MNKEFRNMVIDKLRRDEDLPVEWARELFPPERREYELTYVDKEREEEILSNTMAVPLQPVRTFGTNGKDWHNMLIFGDNLQVLRRLLELKKIGLLKNSDGTSGFRLIYIDPPFATKQEFRGTQDQKAYQDKIIGAKFVEFIRRRLIFLRELLHQDGSLFIHLDWKKAHYVKVILDEIMGENNFKNEIIWRRTFAGKTITRNIPQNADIILWYIRSDNHIFNPPKTDLTEADIKQFSKDDKDGRGPYATVSLQKIAGPTPGTIYNYIDNKGKRWKCPLKGWRMVKEKLKKLENDNRLYITDKTIREKYYLEERMVKGKQVDNIWVDIGNLNRSKSEIVNYPTQKPEALLERIINTCSNRGDLILDCFAGSGTTCAVAEKMSRRWVAIDCGKFAIYTIQKRMLNLQKEIGQKGPRLNPSPFTLYNAGLYDFSTLRKLAWEDWRFFALQLFGCKDESHTIGGLKLDGKLKGASVLVFNHQENSNKCIDEDTIRDIHTAVGKRIGSRFFIIAPRGVFDFQQDYIDVEGVRYYALRIPYSVISELHRREFSALQQPNDEDAVNDIVEAWGFDFIRPPKVTWTVGTKKNKGAYLKIKGFQSYARLQGEETKGDIKSFSILLLDLDYDGEIFDLDRAYFAHQLKENKWEAIFPIEDIKDNAMAVFMDIYGNEASEVIPREKFGLKAKNIKRRVTTERKTKKR